MKDLWERFKGWWCGQDLFDVALKEQSRRTEETLERHRTFMKQALEIERAKARAELRDRFAAAALTGFLVAGDNFAQVYNREEMAIEAWKQADAMLKARDGSAT